MAWYWWVLIAVLIVAGTRDIWRSVRTPPSETPPDPSWLGLPFFFTIGGVCVVMMVVVSVALAVYDRIAADSPGPYRQVR